MGVDGPDVLVDDAEEDELHRTEEEHADDQRGRTELEGVPVNQLVHQVARRHQQAQAGGTPAVPGYNFYFCLSLIRGP